MEDGSHLHELLETLESGVLTMERGGGDPVASVHRLFQSAHNLKSGLAMAGLERASKLFHTLEDGLDDIRRGRLAWNSGWADALLETVDRVKTCVDDGNDEGLDTSFSLPEQGGPGDAPPVLGPEEAVAALQAASQGRGLFRIEKLFLPGLTREEFEGHIIYDDIRDCGTLLSVKPDWDEYAATTKELVVRFLFSSSSTQETLAELFFDPLIALPVPAAPAPQFKLLVVDDEPLDLLVVRRAVEGFGEIVLARDGAEGLEQFCDAFRRNEGFDVVILDLEMPELGGHGMLQALRDFEETQGIFGLDRCLVFMNTSSRDWEKVKTSFQLQADRYFIKPLSVNAIKKRLNESLPWLKARRRGLP